MVIKRTNANNDKLTRRSLQEEFALTPARCNRSFSLLKHRNIQDVLKYESHDGRQVTQADKQLIRWLWNDHSPTSRTVVHAQCHTKKCRIRSNFWRPWAPAGILARGRSPTTLFSPSLPFSFSCISLPPCLSPIFPSPLLTLPFHPPCKAPPLNPARECGGALYAPPAGSGVKLRPQTYLGVLWARERVLWQPFCVVLS